MNLTNFTSGLNGFQGMASQANSVTGGMLFGGGCVVFFLIILMALIRNDRPFDEALLIASWSMFLVSGLFWLAHLVYDGVPIAFFIVAVLSIIYVRASS
jgi:hypothetical protein